MNKLRYALSLGAGKKGEQRNSFPKQHGSAACARRGLARMSFGAFLGVLTGMALSAFSSLALAQDGKQYPSRPVTLVIPAPVGGSLDLLGRVFAGKLSADWGQPVIAEPKTGANGMLAAEYVARGPADGYRIFFSQSAIVQNVLLQPKPLYRLDDFAPVSLIFTIPIGYAINSSIPAKNLAEFLKLAKQRPGHFSYGSLGLGSTSNILGEGLSHAAGVNVLHVPFRGEADMFPVLASGELSSGWAALGFFARQASSGKVRVVAVASPSRVKNYPDVPTLADLGFPNINLGGWLGVFVPAAVSPDLVGKLAQEFRKVTAMADVQARIYDVGYEPAGSTSEVFAQHIKSEIEKWTAVIKENNIKLQ